MNNLDFFADVLADFVFKSINGTHIAVICKVVSVNHKSGRVDVKPYGKYIDSRKEAYDYSTILNVPIIYPHSYVNGASIQVPISVGDDCLVIFNDASRYNWDYNDKSYDGTGRSYMDAVAIVGLTMPMSKVDKEDSLPMNELVIKNGDTKLLVKKDGITIELGEI